MKNIANNPLHIVIIGAGFTGTALAANLYLYRNQRLRITLIEKRLNFGLGEAYSTPFLYHLLNVRAKDMSAFQDDLDDFTNWIRRNKDDISTLESAEHSESLENQFVPRAWYGEYLQHLLKNMQNDANFELALVQGEAVSVATDRHQNKITLDNGQQIYADQVVFALGNGVPTQLSAAISNQVSCLQNPWDYRAPAQIAKHESVMIVGTGLSMIDAVLTLHYQGHEGKIYTLSRRGLVPLRHTALQGVENITAETLSAQMKPLFRHLREIAQLKTKKGINWRLVINGFRLHFTQLWKSANVAERKRFLRHILPYWNIHRHRVHDGIADLLDLLIANKQLEILPGRILSANNGSVLVKKRSQQDPVNYQVDRLINCMGPSMYLDTTNPLIKSLIDNYQASMDVLHLGFAISEDSALIDTSGKISMQLYSLGPPTKGVNWACTSVPEIRHSCSRLAKHILSRHF